MSKKTKLTMNEIDALIERMRKQLSETTLYDGKLSLSFDTGNAGEHKAILTYSQIAFSKMLMLMMSADNLEVGWNAWVERRDTGKYYVKDIFVAPQNISGATVKTDGAKFGLWLTELNRKIGNGIRLQGHYHVNFGTTPSTTDTANWQEILTDVGNDMFYVFTIWNKKLEHYTVIFDNIDGIKYENADIDIEVDGFDIAGFMEEKTENVKHSYSTTTMTNHYPYTTYVTGTTGTTQSKKPACYDEAKPYMCKNDSNGVAPLYRDGFRVDEKKPKTTAGKVASSGKKKVLANQLDMLDPCGYDEDDWRE